MSRKRKLRLPSYRNPPVMEVVCGLKFEPIRDLNIGHIGAFWNEVRGELVRCEHAAPLDPRPELADPATGLPLPRVWMINKHDDRLLQIQNNIFYYNWRKREDRSTYPRYSSIIKPFKKYLDIFNAYLDTNQIAPLQPVECELTYINALMHGEVWSEAIDLGKVFPDFKWRSSIKRFLPYPTQIAWNANFPLPDNKGRLIVRSNPGIRRVDNAQLIQFEVKALGLGSDKSLNAIWRWFDVAHEWIVRGFTDLTGSDVQQKIWRRDDSFTG